MLAILILLLLLSFSGLWLTFSDVLPSLFLLKSSFPSSKHLVLIKNTRGLSEKVSKSHAILFPTETGLCPRIQNRREAWGCLKQIYCCLKGSRKSGISKGKTWVSFSDPLTASEAAKGGCCPRRPYKDTVRMVDPQLCQSLSSFCNNSALQSNKTRLVPSGKLPGKIDQQKSDAL